MVNERTTPLRERMIEDMRIRGLGHQSQRSHIRAVKDFASFLGHSPDTATHEELRAYQLHMTDTEVMPSVYNARITALRFFFSMTCGRDEMKKYMQFCTQPLNLFAQNALTCAVKADQMERVLSNVDANDNHLSEVFRILRFHSYFSCLQK
jgi:site-specific recombinase XerD